MKKSKLLLVVLSLAVIILAFWFLKKEKNPNSLSLTTENTHVDDQQNSKGANLTTDAVISDIDKIQKINLASGELGQANELEKEDLNGFENFPKIGENGGELLQQGSLLKSKAGKRAIVQVFHYKLSDKGADSVDPEFLNGTDEFLCDLEKHSCGKSELLLQDYNGLEKSVKDNPGFYWSTWDDEKNKLVGIFEQQDGDKSQSYIYVCDTVSKKCQKNVIGSLEKSNVPLNAVSPSMDKIAVVSNNAKEGSEKKWELAVYKLGDPSKIFSVNDISVAIADGDEQADGVNVVAWSGAEDKIAIGTSNKVFILDVERKGLSMVYMAPTEEEEEYDWNYGSLYLSPDAGFVALVDSNEILDEEDYEQDPEIQTINNLKRINLETKKVDILYSSEGLEMRF